MAKDDEPIHPMTLGSMRRHGIRGLLALINDSLFNDLRESFVELPGMPSLPRKHHPSAEQRRALQLLADIPFGATETAMSVNGFRRQTIVRLVRAGLATTDRENLKAGQSVGRVRITEAGRCALEGLTPKRRFPRLPEDE